MLATLANIEDKVTSSCLKSLLLSVQGTANAAGYERLKPYVPHRICDIPIRMGITPLSV